MGPEQRRAVGLARVLVVAADAAAIAPVCAEFMRRGAALAMVNGIPDTTQALRTQTYDTIVVHAREGAPETLLLLQLLKAQALGTPKILLLIDPEQASAYSQGAQLADAMLASTISPARIAEAAGVEAEEAPQLNLPAVVTPDRQTILALPAPLPEELLPEGVRQQRQRGQKPDLVVLTDPSGANLITSWMSAAAAAVVPVIDASGRARHRADATLSAVTGRGLAETIREIEPLVTRMQSLPESYFSTRDPRAMLMARLAVRERPMGAMRDPTLKSTIRHADESALAGAVAVAESLVRTGHMRRTFFDRVHCCPTCQSSRLNVREECSQCHSGDIVEEPIIHHLRCGYQGPERDFKVDGGHAMVCPKCRQHLEHFSVDYDKPASLMICNACGHTTGDAAIGFVCLDCETHHDAEKVKTKTISSYDLTESGREAAFMAPLDERGSAGEGGGEPSVRDRLRVFAATAANSGRPYAVMMIRLDVTGEARKAAGERVWHESRALYASILREIFNAETQIVEIGESFIVMIPGETREKVETALPDIRNELEKSITIGLGSRYDVLGPDQISAFL
jgi:hypothetical protein